MMTLLLLVAVSLITTSPAALSATASPETVACGGAGQAPDLVPEVRSAAATAAAMQLNRALFELLPKEFQRDQGSLWRSVSVMMRAVPFDRARLDQLSQDLTEFIERAEAIARGPNPECRSAVTGWTPGISDGTLVLTLDRRTDVNLHPYVSDFGFGPLPDAYVLQAFVQAWREADRLPPGGDFPTATLYDHVGEIAASAYEAQSYSLALARAMVPVWVAISHVEHGRALDLPEGLPSDLFNIEAWRRVACGGEATFESLNATFDGAFQRSGFGRYQYPFRLAAAFAWYRAQLIDFPDHYLKLRLEERRALARDGCTLAFRSYASLYAVPPSELDDKDSNVDIRLVDIIENPENSQAMKLLARTRLAWHLWDSDRSASDLQGQAVGADSVHLRWAASQALAMRWAERVLDGQIDIDTTLSIQGPDGATVASGTLTQLAYETTESDPALARAPVDALALLYLKDAGVLSF